MKKLARASKKFWKDESGVTAIEYGLIASLIAVVIAVGVTTLGTTLNSLFSGIAAQI
jgi:pilus assembly protein Flp/PilA